MAATKRKAEALKKFIIKTLPENQLKDFKRLADIKVKLHADSYKEFTLLEFVEVLDNNELLDTFFTTIMKLRLKLMQNNYLSLERKKTIERKKSKAI